jgi:hypothetical protein
VDSMNDDAEAASDRREEMPPLCREGVEAI